MSQSHEFDSTRRFSDRVENYIKYRPGYPSEILEYLEEEIALTPSMQIADVGSGTGILTELFLKYGNSVYGIEPNREMRLAAEKKLSVYDQFSSRNATAEETTLDDRSVDVVIAGQAFHWFDKEKCIREFSRILKEPGYVVLIWNDRLTETTFFLREYEKFLLRYGTDYQEVSSGYNLDKETQNRLFEGDHSSCRIFPNRQVFNYEGLKGRLLSSSYCPKPDQPSFHPMIEKLSQIFNRYQENGQVVFEYETRVYSGKIKR